MLTGSIKRSGVPMKTSLKVFMAAIAVMGVTRFVLTMAGLPNTVVKFASMSVIIMAGMIYFAVVAKTHKERLSAAYLLILPYMIVEVAALSYTWITGHQTIFHAQEYSFGVGIAAHTIGHLVGGLTWEPLSVFLVMEIIWLIYTGGRRLLHAGA
jgi:uncharacterized membrane protein